MFTVTKYPIWVFAAVLVLSYSLVVRFGHWYRDAGPITYLSSLAGLLLGGFFLWPISRVPDDLIGWLAVYTGLNAIFVGQTLRQRAIYIVSGIAFGLYWAIAFCFSANYDFSEATLFGPLSCSVTTVLNIITAFLIPLFGYFVAYEIAEKRRLLSKRDKPLV